jgi:hypothetical protein
MPIKLLWIEGYQMLHLAEKAVFLWNTGAGPQLSSLTGAKDQAIPAQ